MMSPNTATALNPPTLQAPAAATTGNSPVRSPTLALAHGVTEVFCRAGSQRQFQLLLPSLAQHSHQGRWLTLVAPPSAIHRPSLVKARINLSAMRVIRHNVIKDYWAAVELCLQQGNSSVVIAWTDQRFCDALRAQLKAAALAGHCTLIVMRQLGNSASTATMDNVEVASGPQLSLAF